MNLINLTIPTLLGTEKIVANEVKKLGYEIDSIEDARVNFKGDYEAICLCNLNLRSAERVYIHLADFKAATFEELFTNISRINWEQYIGKNDAFPVKGYSLRSQLHSVPDCQSIIKKSIVNRLSKVYGISYFEETDALICIHFAILKDIVSVYIDTTGVSLYKRGYRKDSVIAPLRETIAYSMIDISFWRGDRPFLDPFCGSGTIPIEAALYAKNIAPGLKRKFASESWKNIIDPKMWADARQEAIENIDKESKVTIFASDIDPNAIELSKINAKRAGVEKYIRFEISDFKDAKVFKDKGVIICNPPYGERLLDVKQCEKIYKTMGQKFSKYENAKKLILTSNEDFEKFYGRKADKKRKIYNGMLKCNIYNYFK